MNILSVTLALMVFVISSSSHAALLPRLNGQVVYDTDLNITWLANSTLASTETFGVDGIVTDDPGITSIMNFETANNWISAMNAYGGAGYLNISNWRLPNTIAPDSGCTTLQGVPISNSTGYNCSLSEMGHLFYNEFGGVAGQDVRNNPNPTVDLFSFPTFPEVLVGFWSATQTTSTQAFVFGFNVGGQGGFDVSGQGGSNNFYTTWAVADGDVAAVPIPSAIWLFNAGILGLFSVAKRRQK